MIKAAVLTALVGLSACNSVMSYSETFPLVNEDYFNLNAYLTGDLAYTTQYKGGAKTSGTATETYGLRMYGFGKFRVQMEFFNSYKHTVDFYMKFFDITPYQQTLWWTSNLENSNSLKAGTYAQYKVALGEYSTIWIENAKTCGDSIYDMTEENRKT